MIFGVPWMRSAAGIGPLFPPVEWHDLVVEEDVERDLRTLVKQLNACWSNVKGITVPVYSYHMLC